MHTAPSSLVLPSCVFPATPQHLWHPSVTATLGTGEQREELGLVSAILVLRCGAESVTSICLLQRGKIHPPKTGGGTCSAAVAMAWCCSCSCCSLQREGLSRWVVVQCQH